MKEREETRFFYGWVVVAGAAVGLFLGVFPIFVASFTMFFPAFMREFHAQRGAIASVRPRTAGLDVAPLSFP